MDRKQLNKLIKECLKEVLKEGRIICAWCKKDLGQSNTDSDSHGICPSCKEKWMKDVKQKKEKSNVNVRDLDEMTGTGAVGGYMSKNWCDPTGKKGKELAAKSFPKENK